MAETDCLELFQPVQTGSLVLKNRIVMLPMHLQLDPTTEQGMAFYLRRARGGCGAILSWAMAVDLLVHDAAWGEAGGVSAFARTMSVLVESVHRAGARMGMQLGHYNILPAVLPYSTNWGRPITGQEVVEFVAPSGRVEPEGDMHGGAIPGLEMRELALVEIEEIVENFGRAAARAREIGFDFVEVHGAHGTLPCQFFSPVDNRRQDRYGGDLAGRMRFGLDCVGAMKSEAGNDYPVWFRIAARDADIPGGITLEDSCAYAAELERAGVDCLDVSVGVKKATPYWLHAAPGKDMAEACFADLAAIVKEFVNVPVLAVGKLHKPAIANEVLAAGRADLIGLGRQLITDPEWPNKIMANRAGDIVFCMTCNTSCWGQGSDGTKVDSLCRRNPEAGRER